MSSPIMRRHDNTADRTILDRLVSHRGPWLSISQQNLTAPVEIDYGHCDKNSLLSTQSDLYIVFLNHYGATRIKYQRVKTCNGYNVSTESDIMK